MRDPMTEQTQAAASPVWRDRIAAMRRRLLEQRPSDTVIREFAILFAVTAFVFFYGLIPIFGGDQMGLVGADEPRYAQVAREMLAAHEAICDELHATMIPRGVTP